MKSSIIYISEHTMVKKHDHKKIDSILRKIYYDLNATGTFVGPDKIYRVIKSKGIANIGKHSQKMVAKSGRLQLAKT